MQRTYRPVLTRQHYESRAGAQTEAAAAPFGDRQDAAPDSREGTDAGSHKAVFEARIDQGRIGHRKRQEAARQTRERARAGNEGRGSRGHGEKTQRMRPEEY